MFQDLESHHGNNLRVRTLMNEDEELKGVYIVNCKSNSAQNSVDHEWEFGKVDKKHIKHTSNVAKEKPQRSGIRKSNGSRANIPLFTFNTDRAIKNADHWKNASNDIKSVDDDASNIDGNWDGKLVYIPIKNYKIDDEKLDLGIMKTRLNHINMLRKQKDLPKIDLFGVRTGDIKKLGSAWINFKDFYLYFSKEVITEDLKNANQVFTSNQMKKDDKKAKLNDFNNSIGRLFCINGIKFPDGHKINEAKKLFNNIENNNPISRYVFYVSENDSDWTNDTLQATISFKDFCAKLNDIIDSYPMLIHFSNHYSSWRGLGDNVQKDIYDYISLCDGVGA